MKMLRISRKAVGVGVVLLALAGSLPAAVITQYFNTGAINPGTPTQTNFEVAGFDTALGTLTRVTLSMSIETWGGYFKVINATDPSTSINGSFSLGVNAYLGGSRVPDGALFDPLNAGQSDTFSLLAAGDSKTITGPAFGASISSGVVSDNAAPANFGLYEGVGTYTIRFNSSTAYDHSSSGAVTGEFGPMTSVGYLAVEYEYEPIPEPASLGLILLGIGTLALRRRIGRKI